MRQISAFLASAIVLGAATVSVPAVAQDVGSNPITELFDGLGLSKKEKPDIDYKERAPLVPPTNTANLPAPQATVAAGEAQWPNDPDVAARAQRKRDSDRVYTETYEYKMDRNPRMDPDELGNRRVRGAAVPRVAGDGTRGDNEIARSSRDELSQNSIRTVNAPSSGNRGRLTDPPSGYLSAPNGVTVQPAAEEKSWLGKMFGN